MRRHCAVNRRGRARIEFEGLNTSEQPRVEQLGDLPRTLRLVEPRPDHPVLDHDQRRARRHAKALDNICAVGHHDPVDDERVVVLSTLEHLRPLLQASPAPRAVMVSSVASLSPTDPDIIELVASRRAKAAAAKESGDVVPTLDLVAVVNAGLYRSPLQAWCCSRY